MIGKPPVAFGAVQVNVALVSAAFANTVVGALGVVAGVAIVTDEAPTPTEVIGETRTYTDVPFVSEDTVALNAGDPVFAVTVVQRDPSALFSI